ncbi:hypothetical protein Q3G72_022601 [Acer saccharum]|nr:hypothetical protein Q3G72_022601 [Acer saccharum]
MLCWAIWEQRNGFLFSGKRVLADLVVNKADSLLSKFRLAASALNPLVQPSSRSPVNAEWLAPPPGKLKLNTAMVSRDHNSSCALGAAVRDDKGKVIVARARLVGGSFNKDTGTLLALREGLLLALFYNLPIQIAEVDFSPVVGILSSSALYFGDASFIVKDVIALMSDLGVNVCQASSLLGNSLARNLAKAALSSCTELFWLDASPSCILSSC